MKNCCENKLTVRGEDEKRNLGNRLNIIEGQIRGINQMVSDDRYCGDILTQISAAINSLKTLSNRVLKDHMETCMVREIKDGNNDVIQEIITLLRRFED